MKKSLGAMLLAMVFALSAVTGFSMVAVGADNYDNSSTNIDLVPSAYPGGIPSDWYSPGDPIEVDVFNFDDVPDGFEDQVDLIVFPWPWAAFDDNVWFEDNKLLDSDGEYSTSISGTTTSALSDGLYIIYVTDDQFIETNGADAIWDSHWFEIHWYNIDADTDRNAYVPGDTVTVFYTVTKIKDGSLVTESGFTGEWTVESTDFDTYDLGTFTEPSGTFSFTITNTGGTWPATNYFIWIWFNGTQDGATREDVTLLAPEVNSIEIDWLESPFATYPLDSVVRVRVQIRVTGTGVPEPGATVEIQVMDGTGAPATPISGYGADDFISDENGEVFYAFVLDPTDFQEDDTYTVRVTATRVLKTDEEDRTFTVIPGAEIISVRMDFDKRVYTSGDTASVIAEAVAPAGSSPPNSYIWEVRSGSVLYAREAGSMDTFNFDIPDTFEGWLTFSVDVFNADGDFGSDVRSRQVVFGVMLVNADRDRYNAGDTITVEYELVSSLLSAPDIFYQVVDANGDIVLEGEQAGRTGSFTYDVPTVPSTFYTFLVFASQDGREASGSDTATLIEGYVLRITFDRNVYSPGDTMRITYSVRARGASDLPNSFRLSYGLSGDLFDTTSSTDASGTVTYRIQGDANEGTVWFSMGEANTGAFAGEMITIKAAPNPLWWAQLADIPLFSIILLILIVILFILLFRRGGAGMGAPKAEGAPSEPAAPPPEEPVSGATMSVACKSCGAPIEITTSKRPIEVMCPSCGETEMVA